jgi:adenosine deaminase
MELRFNPMKRNRGGEQDLDHIVAAAVRGMDRASLEYPIKPGLIFCLDRAFPYELNEIIVEKAITGGTGGRGIDIAGPVDDLPGRRVPRRLRRVTPRGWRDGARGRPAAPRRCAKRSRGWSTRIGHGVKSAYDPRVMPCCASGDRARCALEPDDPGGAQRGRDALHPPFADRQRRAVHLSTDGPEMLQSHLRDEVALLLRKEMMSLDDRSATDRPCRQLR